MNRRAALAAAALALAATAGAQEAPRYTPAEIWRDAKDAAFKERWFGGHLAAMEAPRLAAPDAAAGYRVRSRLLVLPSFARPYYIAVDQPVRGPATLTLVQTDGAGGYGPGAIARRERRPISAAAFEALTAAFHRARFAERAPTSGWSHDEFGRPVEVTQPMPVPCSDGTQLVFERRDRAGYRLVSRHDCDLDDQMQALAETMIAAAGVRTGEGYSLPPAPAKPRHTP